MCPFVNMDPALISSMIFYSLKLFIFVWIIAVPIVVVNRLDKIIKLLSEKK